LRADCAVVSNNFGAATPCIIEATSECSGFMVTTTFSDDWLLANTV